MKTLLDLNSKLKIGNLSLETSTEAVSFYANYTVEDEENIEKTRFEKIIAYCLALFRNLSDTKIIQPMDTDDADE